MNCRFGARKDKGYAHALASRVFFFYKRSVDDKPAKTTQTGQTQQGICVKDR